MSSGNWLVIAPSGATFKTHGTLHPKLLGGCVISDAFGVNAVVPKDWCIITYEYQKEDDRIVKVI